MVHICQIIISPGIFFIFFKILIFGFVGVMTKSYVGRAVLHLRNHSSYIGTAMLWYDSHSVHMCEMVVLELANISRCFFIFQNFDYAQKVVQRAAK